VFEVPTAAQVARRRRNLGEYRVSEGMEPSPAEGQPHLALTCPVCFTVLRATHDQVGQQLTCPDCDTPVVVPPPAHLEQRRSLPPAPLEEYALWDEVDQSPAGPRPADQTYVPVTCPVCGTFMQVLEDLLGHEVVCPDCREPMVVRWPIKVAKKETLPAAQLGEYALHEEAEAPSADAREAKRTLFPLHCPLCDTLLYAGGAQVGEKIICPDCEVSFVVPPPPPPKRKLDLRSQAGAVYGVGGSIEVPECQPFVLTPRWQSSPGAESPAQRRSRGWLGPSSSESPETAALGRRRPELRSGARPPPATRPPPRWTFFSGVFTFPAYRSSWPRWLGLSLGLIAPLWVGQVAIKLAMAPAGPWAGAIPWMLAMVLLAAMFLLGSIWAVVASAQCLSILRDTAYGCDDIENWPEALFLDWIGEFFFLVSSLALSVLPGLVLGRALEAAGVPPFLTVAVSLLLMFPITLLALLETNSPLNPFSLPVWRSLVTVWWAWGLFYIETTVLVATAGCLAFLAVAYVPVVGTFLARPALLVAALMIYFRLLGRLAWRCARAAAPDKRPPAGPVPNDDQEDEGQ
jgi:hypothetical protein